MIYFSSSIQEKLKQAFAENNMVLNVKSDHIIAEHSQICSKEKIQQIVESTGFCPLISQKKAEGNFVFTVAPYKIPSIFYGLENPNQQEISSQVADLYGDMNKKIIELASKNIKGYSTHFEKNKKNILQAAKNFQGELLILGLGNGHDIPLYELVCQFDVVTVLDIDIQSMQKTIKNLPKNLQNKIIPIKKDLTGIIHIISEKIENLKDDVSETDCFSITANVINEAVECYNAAWLTSEKKYNFVISSMLTSQLFSQMHEYVMNVLQNKYPGIEKNLHTHLNAAIIKLMKHTCTAHLDNLSHWTHSDGGIYYADTTYMDLVKVEFEKNQQTSFLKSIKTLETLPNQEINEKIKNTFTLKSKVCWTWDTLLPLVSHDPHSHCIKPGNVMQVAAYFLQPKKFIEFQ